MAKIVNLETAFLYGDLEEEISIQCPQGLKFVGNDDYIISNKFIHCLVQAASQYHKKTIKILKKRDLLEAMSSHAFM